jgi:hypothetical protein
MRSRIPRRLAAAFATATALVLAASATASAIGPGAKALVRSQGAAQGGGIVCKFQGDPVEPLELNTIAIKQLFKTVVMEKEILSCDTAGGAPSIVDLQTFIEVFEKPNGDLAQPPFRVGQVRCEKVIGQGLVKCSAPDVVIGAVMPAPLVNCQPATAPRDPVEMNTTSIGTVVKTITVEKEWARCPNGIIRDVYLFTELVERYADPASGPPTFSVPRVSTWGIVCFKVEQVARIRNCAPFRTTAN